MITRTMCVNKFIISAACHRYLHRLAAALGVLLMLQGCQTLTTKPDPAVLDENAVKRLFVGNTVESFNLNTRLTSFTYYHPSGEMQQERLWARRIGKWSIRPDGKICLAFNGREAKCRHIVREGERHYKILPDENGQPRKIVRYRYFAAGNALAAQ